MAELTVRLAPFGDQLPDVPSRGLQVASDRWLGNRASDSDLLAAKIACWSYLKAIGASISTSDSRARLTRAVLCVLEPDGDEEAASMTAEWFLDMLGGADVQ